MATRVASRDNMMDSATKSKAKADVLVLRAIAGRLRTAWELATGALTTASEPPAVGRNPSGDYGVNGSGPPWGTTWWTSFAGMGGLSPDTTNFVGQKTVLSVAAPDSSTERSMQLHLRAWVQGYEVGREGAPLSRLFPVIVARSQSAGSFNFDVTARSWDGFERTATFTTTGTSEQVFQDDGLWVATIPGSVVPYALDFNVGTSTIGIHVSSVSLNCKRVGTF